MNKQSWKKFSSTRRALAKHACRHKQALPINYPEIQAHSIVMGIFKEIHRAADPELAKLREADEYFTRGNQVYLENSPETYGQKTGKYEHLFSFGKETEPNLAHENSPEFALVERVANLSEKIESEKAQAAVAE